MSSNPARLVITAHDRQGESIVAEDRMVEISKMSAAGTNFHALWGTDTIPDLPTDGSVDPRIAPFPPVGGIRFVQLVVQPESEIDYSANDVQGVNVSDDSAPGRHVTASVDFCVVIEGEVILELPEGREVVLRHGDSVVQNGTLHGWRNKTDSPARLGVFLVGANHSGISGN